MLVVHLAENYIVVVEITSPVELQKYFFVFFCLREFSLENKSRPFSTFKIDITFKFWNISERPNQPRRYSIRCSKVPKSRLSLQTNKNFILLSFRASGGSTCTEFWNFSEAHPRKLTLPDLDDFLTLEEKISGQVFDSWLLSSKSENLILSDVLGDTLIFKWFFTPTFTTRIHYQTKGNVLASNIVLEKTGKDS